MPRTSDSYCFKHLQKTSIRFFLQHCLICPSSGSVLFFPSFFVTGLAMVRKSSCFVYTESLLACTVDTSLLDECDTIWFPGKTANSFVAAFPFLMLSCKSFFVTNLSSDNPCHLLVGMPRTFIPIYRRSGFTPLTYLSAVQIFVVWYQLFSTEAHRHHTQRLLLLFPFSCFQLNQRSPGMVSTVNFSCARISAITSSGSSILLSV